MRASFFLRLITSYIPLEHALLPTQGQNVGFPDVFFLVLTTNVSKTTFLTSVIIKAYRSGYGDFLSGMQTTHSSV